MVTEFEFALHELSELVILATFHPLDEARRVIEQGRARDGGSRGPGRAALDQLPAPRQRRAVDAPELVGRHGIMSLVEWSGDAEEGRPCWPRFAHELGPGRERPVASVPFLVMQTITDDLFAHGLRTYIKAGFAADLTDGLIDALLGRAALLRSPMSQVELLALGGAIARVSGGRDRVPVPPAALADQHPGHLAGRRRRRERDRLGARDLRRRSGRT